MELSLKSTITSTIRHIRSTRSLSQALAVLWGLSSIMLILGLTGNNSSIQVLAAILGTAYTLLLIWYLAHRQPHAADLPDSQPIIKGFQGYRFMLWFIILLTLILAALTSFVLQDGWLMLLFSIPLSLLIIISQRKRLKRRFITASLITMVILAFSEGLLGAEMSSGLVIPIGAAVMLLAGLLLLDHTRLAQLRLLNGEYRQAATSFLLGCVLALPPALLNAASMRYAAPSQFDRLFDRWWEAFYALQPGILEEVWARLLLTTLVYTLLRPVSSQRPQRALIWALVIPAFIHGMAHYPTSITSPLEGIYIMLMYGVPLSLLYVKGDLEQVIAYHFFIDLVRFAFFVFWNTTV